MKRNWYRKSLGNDQKDISKSGKKLPQKILLFWYSLIGNAYRNGTPSRFLKKYQNLIKKWCKTGTENESKMYAKNLPKTC